MKQDTKRLCLLIAICSTVGAVFGATSSQAAVNQCLSATNPQWDCLTPSPTARTAQAAGQGILVGAGAAIGAGWSLRQKQ